MSLVKRERKVPIQDLGAKLRVLADEFLFKNYFNILGRLELLGPVLADFAESPEVAELLVAPVEVANNPTAESVNKGMLEALKLLVKDNIHRAKLIGTEVNWAAIHQAQAAISNAEAQLGPPRVAADQKLTDLNSDGIKITCMGELCGEPVATNSVTGEEDTCSLKLGHFPETPHQLDLSVKK